MSGQGATSTKDADPETLRDINSAVDTILMLCETDNELRNLSLKFKLEQAVDRAAFEAKRDGEEEMLHFRRVLERMADLGLHVAAHILCRTTMYMRGKSSSDNDDSGKVESLNSSTPRDESLRRSSSVEEFCEGSEAWLETGAHLSCASVELLCLVPVSHPMMLGVMQKYLLDHNVLTYITDALSISREHELTFFQEGYRTGHMRLIANLTADSETISSAVVQNNSLLSAILLGTRFDEENPGMVQWAEFTIRNLCVCTSEAREKIRGLTPVGISDESKKLLAGKVDCHLSPTGKVTLENAVNPPAKD